MNGSHGIELHGIEPTFLKIRFVVTGDGFYSYYNLQFIEEKKLSLSIQKDLTHFQIMGIGFKSTPSPMKVCLFLLL